MFFVIFFFCLISTTIVRFVRRDSVDRKTLKKRTCFERDSGLGAFERVFWGLGRHATLIRPTLPARSALRSSDQFRGRRRLVLGRFYFFTIHRHAFRRRVASRSDRRYGFGDFYYHCSHDMCRVRSLQCAFRSAPGRNYRALYCSLLIGPARAVSGVMTYAILLCYLCGRNARSKRSARLAQDTGGGRGSRTR